MAEGPAEARGCSQGVPVPAPCRKSSHRGGGCVHGGPYTCGAASRCCAGGLQLPSPGEAGRERRRRGRHPCCFCPGCWTRHWVHAPGGEGGWGGGVAGGGGQRGCGWGRQQGPERRAGRGTRLDVMRGGDEGLEHMLGPFPVCA